MMSMTMKPIRNEIEYDRALQNIALYFEREPKPGSAAGRRFDALAARIEAYETRRWPIASRP
jgi:HTH-type transcriptional regulator/antitoxin HigA